MYVEMGIFNQALCCEKEVLQRVEIFPITERPLRFTHEKSVAEQRNYTHCLFRRPRVWGARGVFLLGGSSTQ